LLEQANGHGRADSVRHVVCADHHDGEIRFRDLLQNHVDLALQVATLCTRPRDDRKPDSAAGHGDEPRCKQGARRLVRVVDAEAGRARVADEYELDRLRPAPPVDTVGLGWLDRGHADRAAGELGLGHEQAGQRTGDDTEAAAAIGGGDSDPARPPRLPHRLSFP
jgi:hypothetical protein